jgi:hypothetical protein
MLHVFSINRVKLIIKKTENDKQIETGEYSIS